MGDEDNVVLEGGDAFASEGDQVSEADAAAESAVEAEEVADERPEASSLEEARDPAFKVSEGNPYAPVSADGMPA